MLAKIDYEAVDRSIDGFIFLRENPLSFDKGLSLSRTCYKGRFASFVSSIGTQHKASPYEFFICTDHAIIFKGTRSSVAAPHPFEIPLLAFLSGEFLAPALPDAAVARVESDFVGRFNA